MYSKEPMHEVFARSRQLMFEAMLRMYPGLFDMHRTRPPMPAPSPTPWEARSWSEEEAARRAWHYAQNFAVPSRVLPDEQ